MWEDSSRLLPCCPNNVVKKAVRLDCCSPTFVQSEHDVTAAADLVAIHDASLPFLTPPVGGTCNQTCCRAEACKAILLLLHTEHSANTVQAVNTLLRLRGACLV